MSTLHLDPAHPVLWRDAESVQFGADAVLTLPVDGVWLPRMLHELVRGVPARAFEVVAHSLGAPLPEARRLRALLEPVLVTDAPPLAARLLPAPVVGARTVLRLEEALADAGVETGDDRTAPALLVRHGAVPARDAAALLADDRPHLPVSFDAGGSVVGPFVVPGRTPCLSCRDSHDRDRDAAWAAVHVQLLERDPGRIPLRGIAAVADAVRDLLAGQAEAVRAGSARSIRISRDGRRTSRTVAFHAECRCRSPRGSGTVVVLHDPHPATTSSSAYARRA
jgi:hypothetical protein